MEEKSLDSRNLPKWVFQVDKDNLDLNADLRASSSLPLEGPSRVSDAMEQEPIGASSVLRLTTGSSSRDTGATATSLPKLRQDVPDLGKRSVNKNKGALLNPRPRIGLRTSSSPPPVPTDKGKGPSRVNDKGEYGAMGQQRIRPKVSPLRPNDGGPPGGASLTKGNRALRGSIRSAQTKTSLFQNFIDLG